MPASNCGFITIEQCMATVSDIGGPCQPNQFYNPRPAASTCKHCDVRFAPESEHVRCNGQCPLGPKADIGRTLFDHLVGKRDECWRNFEAKSLGGLKIEHEFELGRLYDR